MCKAAARDEQFAATSLKVFVSEKKLGDRTKGKKKKGWEEEIFWIGNWNRRTQWTVQRIGKVHSPVQNRAYQRVSMYHQLLIASQYLSSRFPPIYRPRLPPLVLSHPKGTSTKDHFSTTMGGKKNYKKTLRRSDLHPSVRERIINDIFFLIVTLVCRLFSMV